METPPEEFEDTMTVVYVDRREAPQEPAQTVPHVRIKICDQVNKCQRGQSTPVTSCHH